jgi:DNA-binding transcriptional LysR family regulator
MADDVCIVIYTITYMNQLQAMRVFTRVVDLASFNLAARQLGMSAAAVTRSVSMLEAHLNMRLLNRTTRSLSLTEIGKEYLEGCRMIIEKLDEMESNLVQATRDPRGTLRIAAPATFASSGLGTLLAAYRALHPRVDFDVTTFDNHIDMVEGGFDVCFSDDRRLTSSTLVSRRLTTIEEVTVASPAYLARNGTPRDPAALSRHALLTVSDGSSRTWEYSDANGVYRVSAGSALSATSSAMVRVAALNHMGVALLPLPLAQQDLVDGTLVPVLDQFEVNGGPRHVSILYSGRNYLSMKVRSFIDFAVSQYRAPDKPVALRAVA